jgi:hypothetical protein
MLSCMATTRARDTLGIILTELKWHVAGTYELGVDFDRALHRTAALDAKTL